MRSCNLQLGSIHAVEIVLFVIFYKSYVCLPWEKYHCHFYRRLHHRYTAV